MLVFFPLLFSLFQRLDFIHCPISDRPISDRGGIRPSNWDIRDRDALEPQQNLVQSQNNMEKKEKMGCPISQKNPRLGNET